VLVFFWLTVYWKLPFPTDPTVVWRPLHGTAVNIRMYLIGLLPETRVIGLHLRSLSSLSSLTLSKRRYCYARRHAVCVSASVSAVKVMRCIQCSSVEIFVVGSENALRNDRSRSFGVVDFGTNWKRVCKNCACNLLLVISSNLGPILPRFKYIADFLLKTATPVLFHPNLWAFPWTIVRRCWSSVKWRP